MKTRSNNLAYYLGEVITLFKLKKVSTIFSVLSVSLIFFLVLLSAFGWFYGNKWIERIRSEAEVAVYFEADLNGYAFDVLKQSLSDIKGVKDVIFVPQEESYSQMYAILGEDASILELFEENPFQAYFSLKIEVEAREEVSKNISTLKNITYYRDNKDILDKMSQLIAIVKAVAFVVLIAVSFTTWIITSHVIREGIQSNKTHIETLQLLGAPKRFIWTPYLMQGTLVTTFSSLVALVALAAILIDFGLNETLTTEQSWSFGGLFIAISVIIGFLSSLVSVQSVQLKPQ